MWISPQLVPNGPTDNKTILVTAWRRAGDKPLPEPMLTHFTDKCGPTEAELIGTKLPWNTILKNITDDESQQL